MSATTQHLRGVALLSACLAGLPVCLAGSPEAGRQQSPSDGWRTILEGEKADGWAMVGPGELKPQEGALVTRGGMGLFWYTKEKLSNCEIRVVFKLTGEKDNSGIFIRIPEVPTTPWDGVNRGYEVQIDNNGDEWHRTGVLYSLTKAKAVVPARVGEWNTMIITLDGTRTRVELNGTLVTDYTEGEPVPEKKIWYEPERGLRPEAGYIGLQNHDKTARVVYREVSVRPLR